MTNQVKFLFRLPYRAFLAGWASLLVLAVPAVDATAGQQQGKEHGVYTTLYTPETAPLASFDMPGSAYFEYDNFGPDEIPLAVIRGYDGYNVTLELIDLTTKETLTRKEIYNPPGRASVQPILINRTGEYEVRILLREKEQDTFKFSVTRPPSTTRDGKVNYDAVIARTSDLLKFNASDAVSYDARASAHAAKGELDEAIADYTEALRLRPYDATAHALRGIAYSKKKKWDEAIGDASEFIRLRPDDPRGPYARAVFFELRGDFDKAITDLRGALRILPTYTKAENELAWLLATCPRAELRNGKESVELATKACERSEWKKSGYIDTLAAACAENGDFASAIKYEKQAMDGRDANAARLETYQRRLLLYEQNQAYRQPQNQEVHAP
jgi:tetratricopeptide (TPR) repeat protein